MELSKGIRSLLVTFLNDSVIIASWGITDIKIEDNKLSFKVDGLIYQGAVVIIEQDCNYLVIMEDCEFSSNLDILVNALDEKIEKTENYTDDLINWIENK